MTCSILQSPVTVRGVGLHTGAVSHATLHPAVPGSGIVFRIANGATVDASANRVVDTARCTVLAADSGDRIATVEHLLSACAGLNVADLVVEVSAPEMPIGDGSSACWVDAIHEGGLANHGTPVRDFLTESIVVTGKNGAFIAAYPAAALRITTAIHFPHPLVDTQVARFDGSGYESDIAGARTFGFIEEVEALRAAGLALGGTLDNAVVIYPDRFSTPLRFENELARHKLLDIMGDLALGGSAILPNADIIAVKPSHRLNTEMALRLLSLRLRAADGPSNED